jgi:hypothetical protein
MAVTEAIGKLCVAGDWACAGGDLVGLRLIAKRLAAYSSEPLHCELAELAEACTAEPERAVALWDRLKNLIYREATA